MDKEEKKKFYDEIDAENAPMDAIILAFDFNIKYDYDLPSPSHIRKAVIIALKKRRFPKEFKDKIWKLVKCYSDSNCSIEHYMGNFDHHFGNEFFYGHGTLYRWRKGEREKHPSNFLFRNHLLICLESLEHGSGERGAERYSI